MCLGKAYLKSNDGSELILDSISLVEISDAKLKLSTIFGDQKEIEATIKEIDFENSTIILEGSHKAGK